MNDEWIADVRRRIADGSILVEIEQQSDPAEIVDEMLMISISDRPLTNMRIKLELTPLEAQALIAVLAYALADPDEMTLSAAEARAIQRVDDKVRQRRRR